jgi:hypothetical protein
MCKKAMEKAIIKVIMETRHKEKEENRVKIFATYFPIDEHAFQCVATRSAKVDFEYNWSTTIVKEAW